MREGKKSEGGGAFKAPPPPGSYRVKATGTYNNIVHNATIDNLLTLLHVRSHISYIEWFDGSDIDDLIELVATL